jgi:hypothetical protein
MDHSYILSNSRLSSFIYLKVYDWKPLRSSSLVRVRDFSLHHTHPNCPRGPLHSSLQCAHPPLQCVRELSPEDKSVGVCLHPSTPMLTLYNPICASCGMLEGNLYLCINKKIPVSKFYWYMLRIMISRRDLECMAPIRQVHLRSDYGLYKRGCELGQHSKQEGDRMLAKLKEM